MATRYPLVGVSVTTARIACGRGHAATKAFLLALARLFSVPDTKYALCMSGKDTWDAIRAMRRATIKSNVTRALLAEAAASSSNMLFMAIYSGNEAAIRELLSLGLTPEASQFFSVYLKFGKARLSSTHHSLKILRWVYQSSSWDRSVACMIPTAAIPLLSLEEARPLFDHMLADFVNTEHEAEQRLIALTQRLVALDSSSSEYCMRAIEDMRRADLRAARRGEEYSFRTLLQREVALDPLENHAPSFCDTHLEYLTVELGKNFILLMRQHPNNKQHITGDCWPYIASLMTHMRGRVVLEYFIQRVAEYDDAVAHQVFLLSAALQDAEATAILAVDIATRTSFPLNLTTLMSEVAPGMRIHSVPLYMVVPPEEWPPLWTTDLASAVLTEYVYHRNATLDTVNMLRQHGAVIDAGIFDSPRLLSPVVLQHFVCEMTTPEIDAQIALIQPDNDPETILELVQGAAMCEDDKFSHVYEGLFETIQRMTSTTAECERVRWWFEQFRVYMRRASADDTRHVRNRMQHPPH